MSTYTVAQAKNKLSELINRALKGEGVVITRHGHPVVEMKSVQSRAPRPMTEADWEWLLAHKVGRLDPDKDAVELLREMREEGEV
jgi:prevent-host-death family protein